MNDQNRGLKKHGGYHLIDWKLNKNISSNAHFFKHLDLYYLRKIATTKPKLLLSM